ncbi:rCG41555 [Rattus norvegicus]|uniref:RCG41555 n=1 Tax=Rattus norvegicus TaxID=10116 RepID=A6IH95_RAT|nr:rCG41555 [Rattus norvegicus]
MISIKEKDYVIFSFAF